MFNFIDKYHILFQGGFLKKMNNTYFLYTIYIRYFTLFKTYIGLGKYVLV